MPNGICPFADIVLPARDLKGWSPGYVDRVGFCDHTAGGYLSTMSRPGFWNDPNGDGNTNDAVSVHFAIGLNGRLIQVLNIFDTAFAQGRLGPVVTWPPYDAMGRKNPNGYLISTEHEDEAKAPIWTPAMYEKDLMVKTWCVEEVKRVTGKDLLVFGIDSLTGHHMFDGVNRTQCPGPYWRTEYRERLYRDLIGGEVFTRLPQNSANPSYWHALEIHGEQGIDARGDFNLPANVQELEIELAISNGAVDVMDGGTIDGLAFFASGVSHGRVKLDSNGAFWFRPAPSAVFDWIRCVGYYT